MWAKDEIICFALIELFFMSLVGEAEAISYIVKRLPRTLRVLLMTTA